MSETSELKNILRTESQQDARFYRVRAIIWRVLSLTLLVFAVLAWVITGRMNNKPQVPVDLMRPDSIRALKSGPPFPSFRGRVGRVEAHYLLYPLAIFEYQEDGDKKRLKAGRPKRAELTTACS